MKYTVKVNLEGRLSTEMVNASYKDAHEYAARCAEQGQAVDVIQQSDREGLSDRRCCMSHCGELVSVL